MPHEIIVVLPDIRATHNTGSFFRTSDAFGVSKIYLTGITAQPPHPHLLKVSLGAEDAVPWEYVEDTDAVITRLKAEGYTCIGVEQTAHSRPVQEVRWPERIALFFGNEVIGLAQQHIAAMDYCVEISMRGVKESLNVSVAGGIVLYAIDSYFRLRNLNGN